MFFLSLSPFSFIFNCIFQILITLAIITLVVWFIFCPNVPKFHIDDVTLTQFNLSDSNDTLHYNLNVNMTFRNPNCRLGIYYDKIEANGLYHGVRFSTVDVVGFYLGHKKGNNVSAVFKGEQVVSGVKGKYEAENGDGVFKIDLKLRLKIRFKVWCMKTPKFKPKFDCEGFVEC
ncbi:putative Late embryogenesis abundant protein [Helianthus annuus]|uniref:Late embryogenesis abundant protein, LEA_2 subgroup n=2 Tax=Helianthus annuus TaxID=4232 RepID=A0A251UKC8_HELAN|nr:putative Late embryogenesis abundant protein, LEA_2 subgroup [Helianthus annuus]KAJ0574581.1 putative Late embryogenesis abundant protein [Helianthus annuus]KAJ0738913.1 putative Late embryogenesis abundant protein [Helianthus annuus]KAJ0741779.1 putative Late embryogenesis abundant protein [Helianthus annuus]KAJ0913135.1 putative Late embryogenesis abundant protein [Helianthus annuus]